MMRIAIVALFTAGAVVAGSWWLGRDAARGPVGESTTVELLAPESAAPPMTAPEPKSEVAASPAVPEVPTDPAPDASAAVPDEWIPADVPFVESASTDDPQPAEPAEPVADRDAVDVAPVGDPEPAPTRIAAAVDQDAWAARIRRMLDVYRRVGPIE